MFKNILQVELPVGYLVVKPRTCILISVTLNPRYRWTFWEHSWAKYKCNQFLWCRLTKRRCGLFASEGWWPKLRVPAIRFLKKRLRARSLTLSLLSERSIEVIVKKKVLRKTQKGNSDKNMKKMLKMSRCELLPYFPWAFSFPE